MDCRGEVDEGDVYLPCALFELAKAVIAHRALIPAALAMDRFVELNTQKANDGNFLATALTPVKWIAQLINKLAMPLLGRSILSGHIGDICADGLKESTSAHQKMRVLNYLIPSGHLDEDAKFNAYSEWLREEKRLDTLHYIFNFMPREERNLVDKLIYDKVQEEAARHEASGAPDRADYVHHQKYGCSINNPTFGEYVRDRTSRNHEIVKKCLQERVDHHMHPSLRA